MFKFAIPVLHVTSSAAAEEFYCDRLGFSKLLPIDRLVAPIPVTWA
jgi:extradiol dioxygenase family protein